jgi:hypothetical protein
MERENISRELIDITQQEYFVDLERKYFSYETSDELIKKRYESIFVKAGFSTGKKLDEFSIEINKFITFDIEGVIKIRMAIPLKYIRVKDTGYIFCPIESLTNDNETLSEEEREKKKNENKSMPLLSGYLKNAIFKSIDFQYSKNPIIYDSMSFVLNGIRRKFANTIYKGTDVDFIVDFFESFYKKHIVEVVINLANSHFEEAEVKKYGNSYSVLYRDLESFKFNNPDYDYTDLEEKLYTTFTNASLPFEFENLEVDDVRFTELDPLMNYRIRTLLVEDEVFQDYNLNEENLTDEEFEERSLFISPVLEFKNFIYSIPDEDFTPEIASEICSYFGVNQKFYERTKGLEVMLESNAFLKYCLEHYLSLTIFYGNMKYIKEELDKLKLDINSEEELFKQNETMNNIQV